MQKFIFYFQINSYIILKMVNSVSAVASRPLMGSSTRPRIRTDITHYIPSTTYFAQVILHHAARFI